MPKKKLHSKHSPQQLSNTVKISSKEVEDTATNTTESIVQNSPAESTANNTANNIAGNSSADSAPTSETKDTDKIEVSASAEDIDNEITNESMPTFVNQGTAEDMAGDTAKSEPMHAANDTDVGSSWVPTGNETVKKAARIAERTMEKRNKRDLSATGEHTGDTNAKKAKRKQERKNMRVAERKQQESLSRAKNRSGGTDVDG